MGALAVILLRVKGNVGSIIGLIALNIFISVTLPGVSLWGHLGGLVAGALAAAGFVYIPKMRGRLDKRAIVLGWASVAAIAALAVVVMVVRVLVIRAEYGL
jgi:membrane associated rhomboid family serine protease